MPVTLALGRKRQAGASWLARPATAVSSQFIERPCLKDNVKVVEEDMLLSTVEQMHCIHIFTTRAYRSTHAHTQSHATHTCAHTHAEAHTCRSKKTKNI